MLKRVKSNSKKWAENIRRRLCHWLSVPDDGYQKSVDSLEVHVMAMSNRLDKISKDVNKAVEMAADVDSRIDNLDDPAEIDYYDLGQHIDYSSLVYEISYGELNGELDYSEINVDLGDLADCIDVEDLAKELNPGVIRNELIAQLNPEVMSRQIADRIASRILPSVTAECAEAVVA